MLTLVSYDHYPILLTIGQRHFPSTPTYRLSRYETSWSTYEGCADVVLDIWLQVGSSSTFTKEEVKAILFHIGPYKALGSNGYGACFLPRSLVCG